jgi:hypothetical protein
MKLVLCALLMIAMSPAGSAEAEEHFACNMKALSKSERGAHQRASRKLLKAVLEQKELPNGYAFRLPPATLAMTAQWVSLESKCCPFFGFEFELSKDEGPLWLRVTGSEGIKPFILAEFGLDAESARD